MLPASAHQADNGQDTKTGSVQSSKTVLGVSSPVSLLEVSSAQQQSMRNDRISPEVDQVLSELVEEAKQHAELQQHHSSSAATPADHGQQQSIASTAAPAPTGSQNKSAAAHANMSVPVKTQSAAQAPAADESVSDTKTAGDITEGKATLSSSIAADDSAAHLKSAADIAAENAATVDSTLDSILEGIDRLETVEAGDDSAASDIAAADSTWDSVFDAINQPQPISADADIAAADSTLDSIIEDTGKAGPGGAADDVVAADGAVDTILDDTDKAEAGSADADIAAAGSTLDSIMDNIDKAEPAGAADDNVAADSALDAILDDIDKAAPVSAQSSGPVTSNVSTDAVSTDLAAQDGSVSAVQSTDFIMSGPGKPLMHEPSLQSRAAVTALPDDDDVTEESASVSALAVDSIIQGHAVSHKSAVEQSLLLADLPAVTAESCTAVSSLPQTHIQVTHGQDQVMLQQSKAVSIALPDNDDVDEQSANADVTENAADVDTASTANVSSASQTVMLSKATMTALPDSADVDDDSAASLKSSAAPNTELPNSNAVLYYTQSDAAAVSNALESILPSASTGHNERPDAAAASHVQQTIVPEVSSSIVPQPYQTEYRPTDEVIEPIHSVAAMQGVKRPWPEGAQCFYAAMLSQILQCKTYRLCMCIQSSCSAA